MAAERFQTRPDMGTRIAGRVLATVVYVVTVVLAFYVTRVYFLFPQTDDAFVRANTVGIAPHVSGPIVELPIRDNQHVKRVTCCSLSTRAPTRPIWMRRKPTWT
jgi:multidrug resistance efflux pump